MNEEAILRYIFSRLAGGQNIAIISPDGGEETKLLQLIGNIYLDWLPDTSQWVFVYIAATELGTDDTAKEFWQKIWRVFAKQSMGQSWHELLNKLVTKSAVQPFISNRIFRQLDQQQVRLVLLLDNFDRLVENPHLFTSDLLGPLRSLSSRYLSFSVVFTSQRRLSELNRVVAMSGSPPFNNFNEVLLNEFTAT